MQKIISLCSLVNLVLGRAYFCELFSSQMTIFVEFLWLASTRIGLGYDLSHLDEGRHGSWSLSMCLDRFGLWATGVVLLVGGLISIWLAICSDVAFFLIGLADSCIVRRANRDHAAWLYVFYVCLGGNFGPELSLELKELLDLVQTRMLAYLLLMHQEKLPKI